MSSAKFPLLINDVHLHKVEQQSEFGHTPLGFGLKEKKVRYP